MDLKLLSKSFHVRRLDEKDIDMVYDFSCKNELFYRYHPPFVTKESIVEDMKALPPGKCENDKYYVGFFEGNCLVAILDFILEFPTKEIAYIGLFMTNLQYQHKGIGSKIICETVDYFRTLGYKKIRLGVDQGNPQSYAFWSKNQFQVISEEEYIIMELCIS